MDSRAGRPLVTLVRGPVSRRVTLVWAACRRVFMGRGFPRTRGQVRIWRGVPEYLIRKECFLGREALL
jgi:hypothetical protein